MSAKIEEKHCEVCDSSRLVPNDAGGFSCLECGTRQNVISEETEFDGSQIAKRHGKFISVTGTVGEKDLSRDYVQERIDFVMLALESFQALLKVQAEVLIKTFGCRKELFTTIGQLWFSYLHGWQQKGWAKDENTIRIFLAGQGRRWNRFNSKKPQSSNQLHPSQSDTSLPTVNPPPSSPLISPRTPPPLSIDTTPSESEPLSFDEFLLPFLSSDMTLPPEISALTQPSLIVPHLSTPGVKQEQENSVNDNIIKGGIELKANQNMEFRQLEEIISQENGKKKRKKKENKSKDTKTRKKRQSIYNEAMIHDQPWDEITIKNQITKQSGKLAISRLGVGHLSMSLSIGLCYLACQLFREPLTTLDLLTAAHTGRFPYYAPLNHPSYPQEIKKEVENQPSLRIFYYPKSVISIYELTHLTNELRVILKLNYQKPSSSIRKYQPLGGLKDKGDTFSISAPLVALRYISYLNAPPQLFPCVFKLIRLWPSDKRLDECSVMSLIIIAIRLSYKLTYYPTKPKMISSPSSSSSSSPSSSSFDFPVHPSLSSPLRSTTRDSSALNSPTTISFPFSLAQRKANKNNLINPFLETEKEKEEKKK